LDRLKNRGYQGGYDTVKRYVRTIKERETRLAYARFETEPGHHYGEQEIMLSCS
jgi:transposase